MGGLNGREPTGRIVSDRPVGGVTRELGQSEERAAGRASWTERPPVLLGAEGRPWAIPMVWVSRADDGHPVVS